MTTYNQSQNHSTTTVLDLRSTTNKLSANSLGGMEMQRRMEMPNTIELPNTTTLFDLIALGSVRLRYTRGKQ